MSKKTLVFLTLLVGSISYIGLVARDGRDGGRGGDREGGRGASMGGGRSVGASRGRAASGARMGGAQKDGPKGMATERAATGRAASVRTERTTTRIRPGKDVTRVRTERTDAVRDAPERISGTERTGVRRTDTRGEKITRKDRAGLRDGRDGFRGDRREDRFRGDRHAGGRRHWHGHWRGGHHRHFWGYRDYWFPGFYNFGLYGYPWWWDRRVCINAGGFPVDFAFCLDDPYNYWWWYQ